jgi:hypothetical protein
MPVDNERKHGGVAEPLRPIMAGDINEERKEKVNQLALRFLIGKCADRLLCLPQVKMNPLFQA